MKRVRMLKEDADREQPCGASLDRVVGEGLSQEVMLDLEPN